MEEGVQIVPECPEYMRGEAAAILTRTNGDAIRSLTDEELVEKLFQLFRSTIEDGVGDISTLWCDGKAGCVDEDGVIECDDERIKACIMRWLRSALKFDEEITDAEPEL